MKKIIITLVAAWMAGGISAQTDAGDVRAKVRDVKLSGEYLYSEASRMNCEAPSEKQRNIALKPRMDFCCTCENTLPTFSILKPVFWMSVSSIMRHLGSGLRIVLTDNFEYSCLNTEYDIPRQLTRSSFKNL